MSEKEAFKKIAVSETTFSQMSEELIAHLKQKENVRLVVVEDSLIHEHKMLAREKIDVVILSKDEEKELKTMSLESIDHDRIRKQMEEINKIFEKQDLPEIIDYEIVHQEPKRKFYVPRSIGKPNPKKKGGR